MARIIWLTVASVLFGQPLAAQAQSAGALARQVGQQGQVTELVRAFVTAQHDFDLPRIKALTSDDYVEISPLGEVDPREKMLGFYAPEKKVAGPVTRIGDATVTMLGNDAAIVLTSISFEVGAPGQPPRTVSLRAIYVARHKAGAWTLVSAQYTPVRPKS